MDVYLSTFGEIPHLGFARVFGFIIVIGGRGKGGGRFPVLDFGSGFYVQLIDDSINEP